MVTVHGFRSGIHLGQIEADARSMGDEEYERSMRDEADDILQSLSSSFFPLSGVR